MGGGGGKGDVRGARRGAGVGRQERGIYGRDYLSLVPVSTKASMQPTLPRRSVVAMRGGLGGGGGGWGRLPFPAIRESLFLFPPPPGRPRRLRTAAILPKMLGGRCFIFIFGLCCVFFSKLNDALLSLLTLASFSNFSTPRMKGRGVCILMHTVIATS